MKVEKKRETWIRADCLILLGTKHLIKKEGIMDG